MKQHPSSSTFRNDINGLRAWAVVAVVLYHFGVVGFSGGFIGVDIFFVISGFLMTGIVVSGLEKHGTRFSVLGFYGARARRIMPALIALCLVLLLLGWWMLLPLDYRNLGTHELFSLVFLSNIQFWREAGYFDGASHEKWLLHTWSLAVEWQFYLVLPLVLLVTWKTRPGRSALALVTGIGLLLSFALSTVATPLYPTAAFYLLPTRAWEMLAGGMVFLMPTQLALSLRQRKGLEWVGLALIVGTLATVSNASAWPGWRAAVPVLGTACVLLAARGDSVWTGSIFAQWLGTRSYSLYLWHWPIVVALHYLEWKSSPKAIVCGIALTLVLGDLSYRWIESMARERLARWRWGVVALLALAITGAAAGAGIWANAGVAGRLPAAIELVAAEKSNTKPRSAECNPAAGGTSPSCMFGGHKLAAISLGDSHAGTVVSALVAAAAQPDAGVMEWSYGYCATAFGLHPAPFTQRGADYQCDRFLEWARAKIESIPKNVPLIITNRTAYGAYGPNNTNNTNGNEQVPHVYFTKMYDKPTPEFIAEYSEHLIDTACTFAKDRPVYLVRPIPEMGVDVPTAMSRAMLFGQTRDVSISLDDYRKRNAFVWAEQDAAQTSCGVKILDPLPYLCPNGRCMGAKDGRPIYSDDNHLSEYGNQLLVPMFAAVFK